MASTKGISEDFPGAYSGQGRSWELKTKEAIELLPDKYGFQPKVVLSARAPPTITATAVDVPMHERGNEHSMAAPIIPVKKVHWAVCQGRRVFG